MKSNTLKLLESIQHNLKEDEDMNICCNKYLDYVNNHIENVQKAWNEEVSLLEDDFIKEHKDDLAAQIAAHDASKYDEEEFDAYRANYNPINDQEKIDNEANFQAAWYHHFQNNPHHWQHWIDEKGELKPLTDEDAVKAAYIEMICDWQAMGYVFGDTAKQYYDQNKDTIKIYPELKDWFEGLLDQLEDLTNSRNKINEDSYDQNGVSLDFPFWAIYVIQYVSDWNKVTGWYTKDYRVHGDIYPGMARTYSDTTVDTALNYIKKFKTEQAAIKWCERRKDIDWGNQYVPYYIQSIEDLRIK